MTMTTAPLQALHDTLLAAGQSAESRLQNALELVGQHLRADRCFLYVRNPARGRGRIALAWRLDEAIPDPRHDWQDNTGELPQQDPLFRAALAGRPSVFVEDVSEAGPEVLNQDFERRTFGHRALVHAHIVDGDTLWGILQPCLFGHPRHWTAAEKEYLNEAVRLFLPVVQEYMQGENVG